MKRYAIFFCSVLFCLGVFAQNDWVWQNPVPHGNTLYDIHVFDETSALVIGDLGTVMRTDDGGVTWTSEYRVNGISSALFSIFFFDNRIGWAVGEYGNVLRTEDGGESWRSQSSGTTMHLYSVCFVAPDTGWIVGRWGKIFKTVDGGEKWTPQESDTYRLLRCVNFSSPEVGWIVGHGGVILNTVDRGETWIRRDSGTDKNLWSIFFLDDSTGWITGEKGTVLSTTDGGAVWQPQEGVAQHDLASVVFADPDTGYAVGFSSVLDDYGSMVKLEGAILKSTDSGLTWTVQNTETITPLNAVSLTATGLGWCVGESGQIYKTAATDGSWSKQTLGFSIYLNSAYFADVDTGWVVGDNKILRTDNGGASWEQYINETYHSLSDIRFSGTKIGWATGGYVYQTPTSIELNGLILKSSDGGVTWTPQRIQDLEYLFSVYALDDSTAWVTGLELDYSSSTGIRGVVLKTTDGGENWVRQNFRLSAYMYDIFFLNDSLGWAVAQDNRVYISRDGGESWKWQNSGLADVALISVFFIDDSTGWSVGTGGTIIKSVDGGLTWTPQNSGTFNHLLSVYFTDYRTGWAVGYEGTILNTLDGGRSWIPHNSNTKNDLTCVHFPVTSTGWVVGSGGTVLHTVDAVSGVETIPVVRSVVPHDIRLSQNYPNPFNATTTIRFSVPSPAHVDLKVFNLLGEEVETVIDGWRPAGEYQIVFAAKGMPSGVYFYRLKTGEFTATKKFVLQK